MTDTEVVEQRGEYRATITYDPYPSEPDNEGGCPVLRIDEWNRITDTGYGNLSAKAAGIDAEHALGYLIDQLDLRGQDAVEVFDRWLRIWHGGGAVGYNLGTSREYGYIAYVTERMVLEGWGHTPATLAEHPEYLTPELDEWQAYCEGDTFFASVERKVRMNTTVTTLDREFIDEIEREEWTVQDTVGGYYGEKWAREAALEMLDGYAPKWFGACGVEFCGDCLPRFDAANNEIKEAQA